MEPNVPATQRKPFETRAKIIFISSLQVKKRPGMPTVRKKTIGLQLPDEQIIYAELRNNNLTYLDILGIILHDEVYVSFTFEGKMHRQRVYNNIYINTIDRII